MRSVNFAICLTVFVVFAHRGSTFAEQETTADPAEIHAVGVYEGVTETDGKIHGPLAQVTVNRSGKEVILALTSYEPITWEISLSESTSVQRVILGGRPPQAVKGLPSNTPVVETWSDSANGLPYVYERGSPQFFALIRALCNRTDQEKVSSFHGAYRPDSPLVINAVQDDLQLRSDYPTPTPLSELPDGVDALAFQAHHYVPGRSFHLDASYGDYTLTGPRSETLIPLPGGAKRIAFDPVAKQYYGIQSHGVVKVNLEKQTVEPMELGLDVPRLSWPCEITFDTKRRQVILGSSGGGGYLYAYSPENDAWSVLAKRPGAFDAFAYSEQDDCLYGVLFDRGERGDQATLAKVNMQGAIVRTTPFRGPMMPGSLTRGPGVSATRVISAGRHIVILTSPGGLRGEAASRDSYVYLVDAETGKTWLTHKSPAVAE